MRAVPGWMCAIDFSYELGEALGGNTIYPSLEDLRKHHECLDFCGFEEVVTMSKEDFIELVAKAGIDPKTIRGSSNIGPLIWTKKQGLLKKVPEA
jgi:hypothetical protein